MADTTDLTYRNEQRALVPLPSSDDPDVIRRQIDYTRVQLAETINSIGERLSPENLIEQAKSSAREATVGRIKDMTYEANRRVEGVSNSLGQTVRENPLPVAVIGLGLGWLWLANRSNRESYRAEGYGYRSGGYRYYEEMERGRHMDEARERMGDAAAAVESKAAEVKNRVSGTAHQVGESIGDAAQRAGETVTDTAQRMGETISETASRVGEGVGDTAQRVSQTAETVQDRAGEAAGRAREEAARLRRQAEWRTQVAMNRTKQSFWGTMEENPLAIGAVLAIAGAAVGASIPASDYENRLLGETRDRLVGEAKVRAQDAVERVQSVVEETQRAAVTEAKDAAQRHNLAIDDIIKGENSTF